MRPKCIARTAQNKAEIALEEASRKQPLAALAKADQVHPTQISQWKTQLLEGAEQLFEKRDEGPEGKG